MPTYGPKRLIVVCLASVAGLFALDAGVFRTNLYPSVIEPDSSTGIFELIYRKERLFNRQAGDNLIGTMGDSRFAYLPKYANKLTDETGYVFRSPGMAGSDARTWYYMLRDLDPTADRYQAIVFALNTYNDDDIPSDHANDERPLHYLIRRLRLSDILDFSFSYHDPKLRLEALRGTTLKGIIYQRDVQEFLENPKKRIEYVRLCHRGYESWTNDFEETKSSLAGFSVDWNTRKAVYPPGFDENQLVTVRGFVESVPEHSELLAQFRREWFGRILDRYRGSRTKIVFLRLMRGPAAKPDPPADPNSTIRQFAKRPNVLLCDENAFSFLEHPELFKDGLHLNYDGTHLFSAALAREMRKLLGPPRPR